VIANGTPLSVDSNRASSSPWERKTSATFFNCSQRASGGCADQAGNAVTAASTASVASSTPLRGTRAHTSPVAGFTVSITAPDRAGLDPPPIKFRYSGRSDMCPS
jgi:hypothetical protein